ncbi:DUF1850 domain-containing protein [Halalkalicoccus sp. GCM10025322]|uniref:DUF1850 domain-containing protein n=1 Tax=Halalkalicoccus sp. GCM10025322 TaxID=3252661 RepID=UPI00361A7479
MSTNERMLVVASDGGKVLLTEPVTDGTTVRLEYTHSVEKTPVADVYVVDGTTLRMTHMEFDSYGAGLPANAPVERAADGQGYIYELNRTYDRLDVSPGERAGHQLVIDGARYDLVERSGGENVSIYVTERETRVINDVI